jgi:hypothetical protein
MTTLSHTMSVGVDSVLSSRASSETALIGKAEGKPLNSAWSTVRFRRAKTAKAWALLGIPSRVYPSMKMDPL